MTTETNQGLVVSRIKAFGRDLVLACDGKCSKAWGRNCRPRAVPTAYNLDEIGDPPYLTDSESAIAPIDPGTYEGDCGKPLSPVHNKWCFRECERSKSCEVAEFPSLGLDDFH